MVRCLFSDVLNCCVGLLLYEVTRLYGFFFISTQSLDEQSFGVEFPPFLDYKAIMGFPQTFKIPVSRTQMYRQMDNSIAVPVVECLVQNVLKALKDLP